MKSSGIDGKRARRRVLHEGVVLAVAGIVVALVAVVIVILQEGDDSTKVTTQASYALIFIVPAALIGRARKMSALVASDVQPVQRMVTIGLIAAVFGWLAFGYVIHQVMSIVLAITTGDMEHMAVFSLAGLSWPPFFATLGTSVVAGIAASVMLSKRPQSKI